MSIKYGTKKKRGEKTAAKSANIEKQVVKIHRIYQTLTNIRVDYENKSISEIVKREPRTNLHSAGRFKRQRNDEKSAFIKGDISAKIILLQGKVDKQSLRKWN